MAKSGETISTAIGRNLATIREERGLTLRDVCSLLDEVGYPMNVSALSKREHGNLRFSADDLVALARGLGVPVESLLIPPPDPSEIEQLIEDAEAMGASLGELARRSDEAHKIAAELEYQLSERHAEADALKAAAYRLPRAERVRVMDALSRSSWAQRVEEEPDGTSD